MSVIHIVDDEESVRNSLAFLLEIAGYSTRTYASAAAVLSGLADLKDDGCLVTDLRMPEVNGVELLRRLRSSGATIPAIVVTGHADVQMAVEAIREGAFDFIEKPFSDATIISSIDRAMDPNARQAELNRRAEATGVVSSLSKLELAIMRAIVEGKANKLIAEDLGMSPQAVEEHRTALMDRMQVKSLPELVRLTLDIELLRGSGGS